MSGKPSSQPPLCLCISPSGLGSALKQFKLASDRKCLAAPCLKLGVGCDISDRAITHKYLKLRVAVQFHNIMVNLLIEQAREDYAFEDRLKSKISDEDIAHYQKIANLKKKKRHFEPLYDL